MSRFAELLGDRRGYVAVEYTAVAALVTFLITKGMHEYGLHLASLLRTISVVLPG